MVNWAEVKAKAQPLQVWYLNDHVGAIPRFRIESTRGSRVAWKTKTSLKKMKETQNYLEGVYNDR